MIAIRNTQKSVPIDIKRLHGDINTILKSLDLANFDVGVWITTDRSIRAYNRDYRDKDAATDILSFPYHALKPGTRPTAKTPEDYNLGDIIISAAYAQRTARELSIQLYRHLQTLVVHGICHLIGHTHDREIDYKHMQKQERLLLELITSRSS